MATIAWIGLGHMGIPMSKNMLKAGYVVRGVDIDPEQAKAAHEAGVQMFDTPAQACAGVDAVFTMVPAGPDVEKIMTGPDGVFANLPKGAIAIDTSTIGIAYAKKIHAAALKANVAFVEAPVSGGVEGAADGSLTFMIGGADKYVERVKTLLKPMGHFMSHVGGAGAGQAAKVANNLIMGVCVTVNCEASLLARRLGLNAKAFYDIVLHSSGDNWPFRLWNPAPGVLPDAPSSHGFKAGFKTWLLAKDLHLAVEAGKEAGVRIETAEAAHRVLTEYSNAGGADLDTTSLIVGLSGRKNVEDFLKEYEGK